MAAPEAKPEAEADPYLVRHWNGAVTPVDTYSVQAARAAHLTAKANIYAYRPYTAYGYGAYNPYYGVLTVNSTSARLRLRPNLGTTATTQLSTDTTVTLITMVPTPLPTPSALTPTTCLPTLTPVASTSVRLRPMPKLGELTTTTTILVTPMPTGTMVPILPGLTPMA